jgi:hypothetical protein
VVEYRVVRSSGVLGFLRHVSGEQEEEGKEDERQYMHSILLSL